MAQPENVRVEYTLEATVKVGDFEFMKPGYKVSADVPNGEHPNEVRNKLKTLIEGWVSEDVADIRGK